MAGFNREFSNNHVSYRGPVAQWLEQGTHNPLVGGSNPSGPIFCLRSLAWIQIVAGA